MKLSVVIAVAILVAAIAALGPAEVNGNRETPAGEMPYFEDPPRNWPRAIDRCSVSHRWKVPGRIHLVRMCHGPEGIATFNDETARYEDRLPGPGGRP